MSEEGSSQATLLSCVTKNEPAETEQKVQKIEKYVAGR
jgi:hypothetical protein